MSSGRSELQYSRNKQRALCPSAHPRKIDQAILRQADARINSSLQPQRAHNGIACVAARRAPDIEAAITVQAYLIDIAAHGNV